MRYLSKGVNSNLEEVRVPCVPHDKVPDIENYTDVGENFPNHCLDVTTIVNDCHLRLGYIEQRKPTLEAF